MYIGKAFQQQLLARDCWFVYRLERGKYDCFYRDVHSKCWFYCFVTTGEKYQSGFIIIVFGALSNIFIVVCRPHSGLAQNVGSCTRDSGTQLWGWLRRVYTIGPAASTRNWLRVVRMGSNLFCSKKSTAMILL